jgi:hypothetical protein
MSSFLDNSLLKADPITNSSSRNDNSTKIFYGRKSPVSELYAPKLYLIEV